MSSVVKDLSFLGAWAKAHTETGPPTHGTTGAAFAIHSIKLNDQSTTHLVICVVANAIFIKAHNNATVIPHKIKYPNIPPTKETV